MRRVTFLTIVGLLLALGSPAWAKGVDQVTLSHGDVEVTWSGNGEPNQNTILSNLAGAALLYDGVWNDRYDGSVRPAGDLGPLVVAEWRFPGPSGEGTIVIQHLYPFAEGGPVGHVPAGQVLWEEELRESWFPVSSHLTRHFAEAGFYVTSLDHDVVLANEEVRTPRPELTRTNGQMNNTSEAGSWEPDPIAVPTPGPVESTRSDTAPPNRSPRADLGWRGAGAIGAAVLAAIAVGSGMIRRRNERAV